MKRSARPKPVLRFYVAGEEVSGEAFWQAIRDLGGQATITALDPKYRLTDAGRAGLERAEDPAPEGGC
jgi:hypothetical protein